MFTKQRRRAAHPIRFVWQEARRTPRHTRRKHRPEPIGFIVGLSSDGLSSDGFSSDGPSIKSESSDQPIRSIDRSISVGISLEGLSSDGLPFGQKPQDRTVTRAVRDHLCDGPNLGFLTKRKSVRRKSVRRYSDQNTPTDGSDLAYPIIPT